MRFDEFFEVCLEISTNIYIPNGRVLPQIMVMDENGRMSTLIIPDRNMVYRAIFNVLETNWKYMGLFHTVTLNNISVLIVECTSILGDYRCKCMVLVDPDEKILSELDPKLFEGVLYIRNTVLTKESS